MKKLEEARSNGTPSPTLFKDVDIDKTDLNPKKSKTKTSIKNFDLARSAPIRSELDLSED